MQAQRRTNIMNTADKHKNKLMETSTVKELNKRKKKENQKKKKRLIVRNLSFKVTKENLMKIFSEFGEVIDINIPLKNDGKKRGFAFVQYEKTKSLIQAMKALNNKAIDGRCVAIDYAVDKTSYQLKLQNIRNENATMSNESTKKRLKGSDSEDESEIDETVTEMDQDDTESLDENEKRANEFLKEFDSGMDNGYNDESSEESSSNESEEEDEESEEKEEDFENYEKSKDNNKFKQKSYDKSSSPKQQFLNKKKSNDVSEGKTVFLRNVSFNTSNDSLAEAMEKYGECEYCVICIDPLTDHPKGTAFVKFKDKEGFDKLLQDSFNESGVMVDGRKLLCSPAVSKETISHQKDELKKPKDKRNLNLLKVGVVMAESVESKGVSQADMTKRTQLEHFKKQKLKNVNFFISDKRLMVHNLPRTMNDAQLRKLFKEAASKGAVITEARVMKEFKKTNSEGVPLSKGFGFVSFDKHEDALKALMELNNNPNTFTAHKRPIVEFSVENKVALLSKERRNEKIKLRNKKRSEEKQERKSLNATLIKKETGSNEKVTKKAGKKKLKKSKTDLHKSQTSEDSFNLGSVNIENKHKKQKKKQISQQKEKKAKPNRASKESFDNMVNKFKEKLLNKM